MSKSLGNIYTLKDLEAKGIDPIAYKLLCFSSHYRNKLNFTFEGIEASNTSLKRLRDGYQTHLNRNRKNRPKRNRRIRRKIP